jgi:hypothetical protein
MEVGVSEGFKFSVMGREAHSFPAALGLGYVFLCLLEVSSLPPLGVGGRVEGGCRSFNGSLY